MHLGTPIESELGRDSPLFSSWIFVRLMHWFYWTIARESADGAQALLYVALTPDAKGIHGAYMERVG